MGQALGLGPAGGRVGRAREGLPSIGGASGKPCLGTASVHRADGAPQWGGFPQRRRQPPWRVEEGSRTESLEHSERGEVGQEGTKGQSRHTLAVLAGLSALLRAYCRANHTLSTECGDLTSG